MFAKEKALIARENDDGLVGDPLAVELVEEPADALVDRLHARQVVVHVALVAPANEVPAGRSRRAESLVPRLIMGGPGDKVVAIDPRRDHELRIEWGEGAIEPHVMLADGQAAAGEVIEQRRWLGMGEIVVPAEVPDRRRPLAVWRLVLRHEEERPVLVSLPQPLDRTIGDQIGDIPALDLFPRGRDHRRVVVDPLARKDLPVVEAGRIAPQVPLANHRRLPAGLLQHLGEGRLGRVEPAVGVVVEAVLVGVLAGEDRGSARPTDRVGDQAAIEPHPLAGEPVDVRRLEEVPRLAVGRQRLAGQIVGEDEEDIGGEGGRPPRDRESLDRERGQKEEERDRPEPGSKEADGHGRGSSRGKDLRSLWWMAESRPPDPTTVRRTWAHPASIWRDCDGRAGEGWVNSEGSAADSIGQRPHVCR